MAILRHYLTVLAGASEAASIEGVYRFGSISVVMYDLP